MMAMLLLPVDEDAWLFRVCLWLGMALLLLDVVVPRVFRRRVRLVMPTRRRLRLPRANAMDGNAFRRRKRALLAQIQSLEREESAAGEATVARIRKGAKKSRSKARVVLTGEEDAPAPTKRTPKRVSFDMTRYEREPVDSSADSKQNDNSLDELERPHGAPIVASLSPQTGAAQERYAGCPMETSHPEVEACGSHSQRPDPFSLVDDSFPWQLPNYARIPSQSASDMLPEAGTMTSTTTSAATSGQPRQNNRTLNIRQPINRYQRQQEEQSRASPGLLTRALELKHRPLWNRTHSTSPARSMDTSDRMYTSQPVESLQPGLSLQSSPRGVSTNAEQTGAKLLFQPDALSQPSPAKRKRDEAFMPRKFRVPSPNPGGSRPLSSKVASTSTNAHGRVSTPIIRPSKLRTPKIIRRITFDEDMMGALATPQDASPFISDSTRKRQRDEDVMTALDAVGLPWHKKHIR